MMTWWWTTEITPKTIAYNLNYTFFFLHLEQVFSVKAAQRGTVTPITEITLPAFMKDILNKHLKVQWHRKNMKT